MSKGSTRTETSVPGYQEDAYKKLYGMGEKVAQLPFTLYTGPQVAGFNPDQLAGFDATRNMFGQSMAFDPRGQLAEMGLEPLKVNSFYNPFQEQVIDNTMADLNRGRQLQIQSDQDSAIGRGAFGGSRSAVLEAETNRNFADRAGNVAANLRQQGFDSSVNNAMADRNFRSGINQGLLGDQYRNLGFLSNIGAQQQGLQQGAMDAGYNEFMRASQYPYQQLQAYQGAVTGVPGLFSEFSKKKTGSGDILGTLASLAGAKIGYDGTVFG